MVGTAIAQRLYMESLDILVLAIKGVETDAKREPKES
jgi:hypothetical protein